MLCPPTCRFQVKVPTFQLNDDSRLGPASVRLSPLICGHQDYIKFRRVKAHLLSDQDLQASSLNLIPSLIFHFSLFIFHFSLLIVVARPRAVGDALHPCAPSRVDAKTADGLGHRQPDVIVQLANRRDDPSTVCPNRRVFRPTARSAAVRRTTPSSTDHTGKLPRRLVAETND